MGKKYSKILSGKEPSHKYDTIKYKNKTVK